MLLPSYKSIIDYVLISYIHIMYEIDMPFVNGLKEFDEIAVVSSILRRCGGYFIETNNLRSHLYTVIIEELFALMMKKRIILEYHLERRRQRSGKLKKPEEFIFENYINAYLRNADEIDDVMLVPITINYDRVFEGEQFPYELLGEQKPQLSVLKFMKQFYYNKEKQGKVIVKYCKPLSLKAMLKQFAESHNTTSKAIESSVVNNENNNTGLS